MSKTTSKKVQKKIQKAEKAIEDVKQNGLGDGALIVLRAIHEGDNNDLGMLVLGDTASAISALEATLVEVCETSGFPLTRVIGTLLKDF